MNKSKFLKSAKLAIAGVVLATGVSACSGSDKHDCGAKNGCASKTDAKSKCSSKEDGKAKCSSKTSTKRVFDEK
jgi:hypothetical protein